MKIEPFLRGAGLAFRLMALNGSLSETDARLQSESLGAQSSVRQARRCRLDGETLILTPASWRSSSGCRGTIRWLRCRTSRGKHDWTGFVDHFTHVRTSDVPKNVSAMLAGILADATSLGPKRIASASTAISAHQIGWIVLSALGRRPIARHMLA